MQEKLDELRRIVGGMESLAVGFSGGVDSTFLLKVACDCLGDRALGVTVLSEVIPAHEADEAVRLARQIGARHEIIRLSVMGSDAFTRNPPDRCYHCKKAVFGRICELAGGRGVRFTADGANADDQSDHRPGARAIAELGVRSPLLEAGFTKADIRRHSKALGLPTHDRPSFACLASRIPYGTPITREALEMVDAAEQCLRDEGFRQYRVRWHGPVARIELPPEDLPRAAGEALRNRLVSRLRQIGFTWVALDLQGFRSGSLNEALDLPE